MPSVSVSPFEIVKNSKVIAVVGASKNPEKEAHSVPLYLKEHGYRIIPINPTADSIFGEKAYSSLLSLPEQLAREVEVVEIFRPSEELPQIAREVVEMSKRYGGRYVFWAQAGLESDEAKGILDSAGVPYIMNTCMRVVHKLSSGG